MSCPRDPDKDIDKTPQTIPDPEEKRFHDQHGSLGPSVAGNFWEWTVKKYFWSSSCWCMTLFLISCFFTDCCCSIYNFCGACAPTFSGDEERPNGEDSSAKEEADYVNNPTSPITIQPVSGWTPPPTAETQQALEEQ